MNSLDYAKKHGKQHGNVIELIKTRIGRDNTYAEVFKETTYVDSLKRQQVMYEFDDCYESVLDNRPFKLVCGKGINDKPTGWTKESEENYRLYQLWNSMLKRCYGKNAYKSKVEVCERWLLFSNFIEDVNKLENYNMWLNKEGYELDKDIKNGRNNLYSMENCSFVTREENIKERNKNGEYSTDPKEIVAYSEETGETLFFKSLRRAEEAEGGKFSRGALVRKLDNGFKKYKGYKWFTKERFEKYMDGTLGVIDCRSLKDKILKEIKEEILNLDEKPHLAVVQIEGDDASNVYVRNKERMSREVGICSTVVKLPKNTTQDELEQVISELSGDKSIHGVMLQLPVPNHIKAQKAIDLIPYYKDVDALTTTSQGYLFTGNFSNTLQPCTPLGVIRILEEIDFNLEGKNVCVIGRSQLFGNSMAQLLMRKNATVTLCHSKTKNLQKITKESDCVISAVGVPRMIDETYLDGTTKVLIDVGMSLVDDKLIGDVNVERIKDKVDHYTLTPGGSGQITVPMLMVNTLKAYQIQQNK